jgi:uncharacterized membrane protein YedE/YeeE
MVVKRGASVAPESRNEQCGFCTQLVTNKTTNEATFSLWRADGSPRRTPGGAKYSWDMPLILNAAPPLHWAVAGGAIAVVTLTLLYVRNRRLGISGGLDDVCSLVLERPYFAQGSVRAAREWRLPFLVGLMLGGVLSALLTGGWSPTWELGLFDQAIGFGHAGKLAWMFAGGVLIGFGTRLANGCTSGHGIFGISNFEFPSLVATLCFMASGIVTTQVVYRLIFHWAN